MTNDTRSPKEIEREIEEQRSDLTSNLEDLQDKFSIDTLVRQIGEQFREHGGDMGRSISNQVKANPVPLVLTGIGLAWMMFGNSQVQRSPSYRPRYDDDGVDRYSGLDHDHRRSRAAQSAHYTPPTSHSGRHSRGPSWARDDQEDNSPSVGDRLSSGAASAAGEAAEAAGSAITSGATSAKQGAGKGAQAVKDGAETAASKVGDTAAKAGSAIASGARFVQSGMANAQSRIAEGTETLTEEGRQRVIAARRKAIEMRDEAARSMNAGADAAADFYDRQPLVIGALALAVGAAFGGAMPRTKTEDDLVGAHSDSLFDEAERIYEEEKSKVMSVAQSVRQEVSDIASETMADLDSSAPGDKSAVEAVGDKAKSVAGQVADTAKSKAKEEKLGKPNT